MGISVRVCWDVCIFSSPRVNNCGNLSTDRHTLHALIDWHAFSSVSGTYVTLFFQIKYTFSSGAVDLHNELAYAFADYSSQGWCTFEEHTYMHEYIHIHVYIQYSIQ